MASRARVSSHSAVPYDRGVAARTGLLFTLRLIPAISAMLARRGIDAAPLLEHAGVPLDAMRGEITAPLARVQAFMTRAAEALETDLFGLQLAESIPSGSYGIAEFLVRSASTMEDALQCLCEFAPLINPIANMRFVRNETEGCFHYSVASERDMLGIHLNEFSIAYIVRQFTAIQGVAMPLTRVWFAHSRPTGGDDIGRHFGCSVRFQARDCGFAITPDVMAIRLRTGEPLLFEFLLKQARTQLSFSADVDIVSHVVRILEARLKGGGVGSDEVARTMGMTPRTLQRHLSEAGTTFREVITHVRVRRRAQLTAGGLDETTVAKYLGFSDVRAMRRSLDDERG
jgi:AraC-like DNA-binding protein